MLEELKELLTVVSHLPDYVMWVLAGILFYKVFIIGNIYAVLRLAINKTYDFAVREKVIKCKFQDLILTQRTQKDLESFLLNICRDLSTERQLRILSLPNHNLQRGLFARDVLDDSDINELKAAWAFYRQHKKEAEAK